MNITEIMTTDELVAYSTAVSLSAANEPDRTAWKNGVVARDEALMRLIDGFVGPVRLNRNGRPYGGVHPAITAITVQPINGCYAANFMA